MNWGIFAAVVATLILIALLNVVVIRTLMRVHPGRRRLIQVLAVGGNLPWLLIPLMSMRTAPAFRFARALVAPPWFTWAMFVLIYAAFIGLVALVWLIRRRPSTFAIFAAPKSTLFLSLLALVALVGCYQALVPLRTEVVPITIAGLPAGLQGTRLVLLSDLHVGMFTRASRLDQITQRVNELRPDAVLISGDLVDDDPYFAPKLLRGFRKLRAETPLYAVLGNHDIYGAPEKLTADLRNSRIRLLVNEGVPLTRNRSILWLAGTSDSAAKRNPQHKALEPDLARALVGRPPGATTVVLSHQPKIFDAAVAANVPLTLTGHTHGGQFGFRPWRLSLAGLFLKEHMGLYRRANAQMYINTGTGFWVVPFRLGMTSEITLIELR